MRQPSVDQDLYSRDISLVEQWRSVAVERDVSNGEQDAIAAVLHVGVAAITRSDVIAASAESPIVGSLCPAGPKGGTFYIRFGCGQC